LSGGDETIRIIDGAFYPTRVSIALTEEFCDSRSPDTYQRELCCYKKAICQYEKEDGNKSDYIRY
jgi:hypothetical protein